MRSLKRITGGALLWCLAGVLAAGAATALISTGQPGQDQILSEAQVLDLLAAQQAASTAPQSPSSAEALPSPVQQAPQQPPWPADQDFKGTVKVPGGKLLVETRCASDKMLRLIAWSPEAGYKGFVPDVDVRAGAWAPWIGIVFQASSEHHQLAFSCDKMYDKTGRK